MAEAIAISHAYPPPDPFCRSILLSEQADLERNEKRLKALQTHRPAFADELEKLEGELQRYYEVMRGLLL